MAHSMAIQPFKRNSKRFDFNDGLCFIMFTGNGDDITPAEMETWVEKYKEEAMEKMPDPLIVDYDLERAISRTDSLRT